MQRQRTVRVGTQQDVLQLRLLLVDLLNRLLGGRWLGHNHVVIIFIRSFLFLLWLSLLRGCCLLGLGLGRLLGHRLWLPHLQMVH